MIDENQVRMIVQSMLKDAQYSVAKVPAHTHNRIDSLPVAQHDLTNTLGIVAADTSGTATIAVFTPENRPIQPTITGVFLISKDTTAGNVSIYNSGKTVATIVKGTTAGAFVGATSLSNSTSATNVTVASDSAGSATVFLTYKT